MAVPQLQTTRMQNFLNLMHYVGELGAFHFASAAADAKRHSLDHVALLGLSGASIPLVINTVFGCRLCGPTIATIEVFVVAAIIFKVWRTSVYTAQADIGEDQRLKQRPGTPEVTPPSSQTDLNEYAAQPSLPTDPAVRTLSYSPDGNRAKTSSSHCKGPFASLTCPFSNLRASSLKSPVNSGSSESETSAGDTPAMVQGSVGEPISPFAQTGETAEIKRRRNTVSSKQSNVYSAPSLSVVTNDGRVMEVPVTAHRRLSLPDAKKSSSGKTAKGVNSSSPRCAAKAILRSFATHSSKSTEVAV